jgi:hypothetical protein
MPIIVIHFIQDLKLRILYLLISCLLSFSVMESNGIAETKKVLAQPKIAFVVFTRKAWGCFRGQEINKNALDFVMHEDNQFIRVDEIKNSIGRDDRYELYISFLAHEIDGLPGYYVLRVIIQHQDPLVNGYLFVDQARFVEKDKEYSVELRAKALGLTEADILYGKQPQLKTGLFSCPETNVFDPYKIDFLKVYEIEHSLKAESRVINEEWDRINIIIGASSLREARLVHECEELLDSLDKKLSVSKDFTFLWDRGKMIEYLENIISQMEQKKTLKYQVLIKIASRDQTEEVARNGTSFVPKLKQNISIKEPDGKLVGGEVRVGVEFPDSTGTVRDQR